VKASYRVALVCGALPLVAGTSIFALWLATRWEWLMAVGAFALFLGLALFAVGALALARYCWLALRMPEPPPRFWTATAVAAALLLSNFPVAGLILRKVFDLESRYTVVVRNESREPRESVHVMGRDRVYVDFGTVPPGGAATRWFRIRHEGPLELHDASGTTTIDGYVTAGQGGRAIVTIRPDGEVSVHFGSSD
jgi:amino acid transporter